MYDFQHALNESAPWEGVGQHPYMKHNPISFARAVKTPPCPRMVGKTRRSRSAGQRDFTTRCVSRGPTELVVYPHEPHVISERAYQIDVLMQVRRWLRT